MGKFTPRAARLFAGITAIFAQPGLAQTPIDPPQGDWIQRVTGLAFPPAIGSFQRNEIYEYDDAGSDASATYRYVNDDGAMTVTLYAYPASPDTECEEEFAGVNEVIERYPGTQLLSVGTAPTPDGSGKTDALIAHYRIPAGAMHPDVPELLSDAYLYCPANGDWLVKYRASWSGTAATMPNMEPFMRGFDWPATLVGEDR